MQEASLGVNTARFRNIRHTRVSQHSQTECPYMHAVTRSALQISAPGNHAGTFSDSDGTGILCHVKHSSTAATQQLDDRGSLTDALVQLWQTGIEWVRT
jgi:hypothetical protein